MKIKHTKCYEKDYPRPQFVRKNWTNLNGQWDFLFDYDNVGDQLNFYNGFTTNTKINVPFAYQCPASGIGNEKLCQNIWYQRKFAVEDLQGKKVLLHLEGCDYFSNVYVNGVDCGSDEGGYHRQTFDITSACKQGENLLVLKVQDDHSKEKPRGKQRWQEQNFACWYVDVAGLYKTAWIEVVNANHIADVKITPNVADKTVQFNFVIEGDNELAIQTKVFFDGKQVANTFAQAVDGKCDSVVHLTNDLHLWEVGNGALYDVEFTLFCGENICDNVGSYFGMRQIDIKNGKVLLNGKPLYQRLVLDQGYWSDSAITPPSERALENDIVATLEMGFNGARKHQKVEDERYLYYADIYGYLVWAEMPSMYAFTERSTCAFKREWLLAVKQQYNHPCVVCWVPFNESWGVEDILTDKAQQNFVNDVYYATKQIDPMRPVITNDGWEHTISDIVTIHHYSQQAETLSAAFDTVEQCVKGTYFDHDKGAFANGYHYTGQPILITEFGGTSFVKDTVGENWGYGSSAKNDDEYIARLQSLVEAICKYQHIQGFCYTQLSDVYQEVNGLVKFDRSEKTDKTALFKIFQQQHK